MEIGGGWLAFERRCVELYLFRILLFTRKFVTIGQAGKTEQRLKDIYKVRQIFFLNDTQPKPQIRFP